MDLFGETSDWEAKLKPILKKYKGKKHPLEYHNTYQLLVMVVLSAQDSDANINKIAPALFEKFPTLKTFSKADVEDFIPYISKVRNYPTKANWLLEIAKIIKNDEDIPLTMQGLTALKGIGRKSANVILRETGQPAEGIIADLHVIRVAPRIGIIKESKDGNKVEKDLMQVLPKSIWSEIGMAISFLGREICRPKPKCEECLLADICHYYLTEVI
ncbi:Ultraviolet N-glycosylase/AP lyase [Flavobacterium bizetiae]|uniref:Ultraviolet N-glycosylase/AP lyase n=1 Tax=Flavobacterium bizetiae TaxID=2704140 RepID=A0A6J4GX72_9FLAO|nr:endonuclease III [Flavobacterium bizetiae]CAA9203497.1 Ultraviolet N-glycosylase/AP lyase [Flavobacterium bizetiae]CAD5344801.1 Ultraviolet N-glycosylase/AP lyase [Flavobacterium bizetiae]CAD5350899.1 Ultraviolet N-glycosylase/AP lyase [Flavobacterium bizetiae]